MKNVGVNDFVCEFLVESGQNYTAVTEGDIETAAAFYLKVTLGQEIQRRLTPIVDRNLMRQMSKDPERLFRFAIDYLKAVRGVEGFSIVYGKPRTKGYWSGDDTGKISAADDAKAKAERNEQPEKIIEIIHP